MSRDDPGETSQVNVEVPKRTKRIAREKLDHGGLTRVVREALERVAHGEQTTERERVSDHLEELRDSRRDKIQQRNQLDSDIQDLDVKIERAENRLEELRDKEGEYEGALRMVEQDMRENGMHVFTGHARIQDVAEMGNCTEEDVLDDLRERNPDLPDAQFKERM